MYTLIIKTDNYHKYELARNMFNDIKYHCDGTSINTEMTHYEILFSADSHIVLTILHGLCFLFKDVSISNEYPTLFAVI
jgi:hypothetical protein